MSDFDSRHDAAVAAVDAEVRANTFRVIDREINPNRPARFYLEGGRLMLHHRVDRSTVIERPATEGDKVRHPEAWAAYDASDDRTAGLATAPDTGSVAGRRKHGQ